jgi:hypothetical protein
VRLSEVLDASGVARRAVEADHRRALTTVFGEVVVTRLAYRRRGEENLHPADAALNLPEERHSHGLRELAAIEAARGSFEEAKDAIARATGATVAKRQVEELAHSAAVDFEAFNEASERPVADEDQVVVIQGNPDRRPTVGQALAVRREREWLGLCPLGIFYG